MHILILNGPPDTGKDTAADYIAGRYGFTKLEMKGSLRKLAHQVASLTHPNPVEFCNSLEFNRVRKESVIAPELGNRTWPQFLIWLSETVAKPIFGEDVFSRAAVKAIKDCGSDKVVFSDGGFPIEVETIYKAFPGCNLVVAQLYREGRTFSSGRKDSRQYVTHPETGSFYHLENNAGIVQFRCELDALVKSAGVAL